LSKKIIEKTKWNGGLELEYIKSSETGEYYLLEINPRFPAWVYLAPSAGQNLPYSLVKLAFGETVETFTSFKVGAIFVRSSWDLITDIKDFEQIASLGEK
jgi:carbamoyl-phosphate synthase large subunit